MMHPDHFDFIVVMAKAFVATTICVYAFKLGRAAYYALYFQM